MAGILDGPFDPPRNPAGDYGVDLPYMVDDELRDCRNCGSEERVRARWVNEHGAWVRLDCWHVQNDDELLNCGRGGAGRPAARAI